MPEHIAIGAGFAITIVPSDVGNSSGTTFTTLDTKAVLASSKWTFDGVLYFVAAAATTGIVFAVDAPASPANVIYGLDTYESATTGRFLAATSTGTALVGTASGQATILVAYVHGCVEVGATPGNIVAKFRSEVNASAVTVKRGSYLRWIKG